MAFVLAFAASMGRAEATVFLVVQRRLWRCL
jgi:hypothetical protein